MEELFDEIYLNVFNNSIHERIQEGFTTNEIKTLNELDCLQQQNIEHIVEDNSHLIISDDNSYTEIYKRTDEWFYIKGANNIFYKCDTFEGVINCLNNIYTN